MAGGVLGRKPECCVTEPLARPPLPPLPSRWKASSRLLTLWQHPNTPNIIEDDIIALADIHHLFTASQCKLWQCLESFTPVAPCPHSLHDRRHAPVHSTHLTYRALQPRTPMLHPLAGAPMGVSQRVCVCLSVCLCVKSCPGGNPAWVSGSGA